MASESESEKRDKHETVFKRARAVVAKSERRSDNRLPHARRARRSKRASARSASADCSAGDYESAFDSHLASNGKRRR